MVRQPEFFDVAERLRELSAKGDDLERITLLEMFDPGIWWCGFAENLWGSAAHDRQMNS
jgi:hypothetical protein